MPGVDITENYIRIRQKDPSQFVRFATKAFGKGVKAVIGFKKGGGSEAQSFLFDKAKWNAKDAAAWVKSHNGTISGQFEVPTEVSLEICGGFSDIVVTEEIAQQYGLSLADINTDNFHPIEGELMFLDQPCSPMVEGPLKDMGIKQFTFDSSVAEQYLASLKNKPIHVNGNLDGHYDIGADEEKVHKVVGTFLGGRVATKDDGRKVVKFLGGLFDKSMPNEVGAIQAQKENLGASFELTPSELEINDDSIVAKVKSWVFKGAAILKKNFAAFPETSILIAQNADIAEEPAKPAQKIEGGKGMSDEKLYSQSELDAAVSKVNDELAKANELVTSLKEKADKLSTLEAAVADKDKALVSLSDRVKNLETEKVESEITAKAEKWWIENEKFYEAKDKETLISARKAILKKEATPEQVDSIIAAKKTEKAPDLLRGGHGPTDGANIDMVHGIRTKEGFKRQ